MLSVLTGITIRILSNSYLNVFQKILTQKGSRPSVINFYTYLGLSVLCAGLIPFIKLTINVHLITNFITMGILGALGNYYIIKALSVGELSALAPINSYKPVVAMIIAFIYLNEIPSATAIIGILLIIAGTYILYERGISSKRAVLYRVLALIFSGAEAVFIKKIILLTNVPASFVLWSVSGLIFSFIFLIASKNKFEYSSYTHQILLILSVGIMQYSTNFVFSKINVSYALALFQLSTLVSVILGVNIFKEKELKRKIIASLIMISGAVIIILL